MANYIFDEKRYIEEFLNGEQVEEKIGMRYIIGLLFRYYSIYKKDEIEPKNIKKQILQDLRINGSFDKESSNRLQDFELEKVIEGVITKNKKYYKEYGEYKSLKQLEYIPLYSSEFNFIQSLSNDQEKKFMFTCYILARFYNTTWVNSSYTEIFKLANITKSSKDKALFVGKLLREEKISMSDYVTSLAIKLKELKQEDDEEVIKVYQMQNLGNLFLSYIKPNYKQCEKCGKLIKIKGNKTMYCSKCLKENTKESWKEASKKYRNNGVSS